MCGIAGLLDQERSTSEGELEALAQAMAATLIHRGPDSAGTWVDERGGIALGHRRLSIVDLSTEGHQPMIDGSGRYVIDFNGEIYNHLGLRRELIGAGCIFRGTSDTEVLLEAIAAWGLAEALERVNGMFAFGLWDRSDAVLHLVRDRLGEKPLYYGWVGRRLAFASELKALRALPGFAASIDEAALALCLRLSYIPGPYTIYRDVWKLPPGTVLSIDARESRTLPAPQPYWSLPAVAERGHAEPFVGTEEEAADVLAELLADAVRLRLRADVPVGAFLSGGIDSSTIVALMQECSPYPVRTFTVGMPSAGIDESREARAIANHLETDHTEIHLDESDAFSLIPRLATLYDEPFADPSQLPSVLVAAAARREVTVALSGDGGDELFGGYNRYVLGRLAWRRTERLPGAVRTMAARGL